MRNLIGLIALVEYQMCIVGAGFIVCVCMYVCVFMRKCCKRQYDVGWD